jgi:hypothetical protein
MLCSKKVILLFLIWNLAAFFRIDGGIIINPLDHADGKQRAVGERTVRSKAEGRTLASITVHGVPKVVWAFWFGRNMSGARLNAWKSLKANIGVKVRLITERNLHYFNKPSWPMHPAISLKISKVHLGDYLRVYFMHHYGGGYHDIKPHQRENSWDKAFDVLKDPNVWLIGLQEGGPGGVACDESYVIGLAKCDSARTREEKMAAMIVSPTETFNANNGVCCSMIRESWSKLVSNGIYIMRPRTNLTVEWLRNIEHHLTIKYPEIKKHPAPSQRCCVDPQPPYPLRWAELHGEAFHPLQYKYNAHIRHGLPGYHYDAPYRDPIEDTHAVV